MSDESDPVLSFRVPQARMDALEEKAEEFDMDRSRLAKQYLANGMETHGDDLALAVKVDQIRQDIIEFGKPIDQAGGFAGRVRSDFEERFKNGYEPKWLAAKAENYRREARELEEKVAGHPDAPPIEEGELVEEVDRVLRETLRAAKLSDWQDRHENPYEALEGVESGKESYRLALVVTRNMMKYEEELEPLKQSLSSDRRIRTDDLPSALEDEELPPGFTREDIAALARQLRDDGWNPEDLPTDPLELFGSDEVDAIDVDGQVADDPAALEEPDGSVTLETETDGGALEVASDGGDHLAVQAFDEDADDLEQGADDDRPDDPDEETETDGGPTVEDLVEETAEKLREAENYSSDAHTESYVEEKREKRRRTAEDRIRTAFESDTDNWRDELMADTDLTPDDLIDLADEYNDAIDAALRGEREDVPDVVVDDNGGVGLE